MLTTVACYILQLYADFAGYTNIALGIGKLFGVEGPPNFQRAVRNGKHSGIVAPLAYEFDPVAHRLSVHTIVDVAEGLWPGRIDWRHLPQHDYRRDLARIHAQLSRLRHASRRLSQRDRADPWRARPPQTRCGKDKRSAGRNPDVAVWCSVPRRRLTFALMSFSMIFFHSPTWGQAISVLAQVLGVAPSGSTGWSDMPAYLTVPAWICMAIALYVGAGAPGARGIARSVKSGPEMAPVRHLPVPAHRPVDRGNRTLHLWSILTGKDRRRIST